MNDDIDLLDKLNNIMKSYNLDKPIEEKTNAIIFSNKETYYYKMVKKYFRTNGKNYVSVMKNIIDGNSDISLRLLDWFVTRYADQHKTRYTSSSGEMFNVHISYKAQLRSYKKKYFDPFRRRKKKFYFNYLDENNEKQKFFTTIGQLNFFRWVFTNGLINYIENKKTELIPKMNQSYKDDKLRKLEKKNNNIDKNVKTIDNVSIIAKHKIQGDRMKITLSFD